MESVHLLLPKARIVTDATHIKELPVSETPHTLPSFPRGYMTPATPLPPRTFSFTHIHIRPGQVNFLSGSYPINNTGAMYKPRDISDCSDTVFYTPTPSIFYHTHKEMEDRNKLQ